MNRKIFQAACLSAVLIGQVVRAKYDWGNDCTGLNDQYCQQVDCDQCAYSWPTGTTWEHSDAACRCKQVKNEWDWGNSCTNLTDEYCGELNDCTSCLWSWPANGHWSDPQGACRCAKVADETPGPEPEPSPTPSGQFPALQVEVDGETQELFVVFPSWSEAITDDNSLSYDFNNRMYLSTVDNVDPQSYFKANLLGGGIKFDVDLSEVGCGCLTALYTVLMPAVDNYSDPFKYCDASQVGGHWCPEFDIMEANKYAFRAVGHKCDAPNSNGKYGNCDRNGQCHVDVLLDKPSNAYGPGSMYTINTKMPFTIQQTYQETDGQFTGYTTVMTQSERSLTLDQNNCDYLQSMTSDMTNMVIAISNWGSNSLDWLEHGICQGQCDQSNTLSVLSNIKVWTSGTTPDVDPSPEPEPEPTPTPSGQFPALQVEVDGETQELFVVFPSWSEAMTDDSSLSYDFNNRMYLSTVDNVDPQSYFKANLLGGGIKFDVDLSEVGCGCLTALYTVLMPAVDNYSDPFKYCDANQVGGHWCPEFDVMEANKYAFRAVGHKCDAPNSNGKYGNCDRSGQCHVDVLLDKPSNAYGPGSLYTINTKMPFTIQQTYQETDGQFTGYTTVMTQGERSLTLDQNNCDYLQSMTSDMTDMVIAISNWGSNSLDWFQHGICQGQCDQSNTLSVLSNIKVWTSGTTPDVDPSPGPEPEPTPTPIEPVEPIQILYYANPCGKRLDQSLCSDDCPCHMSWPADDIRKRKSSDAACRCLPKQMAPEAYVYKKQCKRDKWGVCDGCDNCKISWPVWETRRWQSPEKMCRCEIEQPSLTYGSETCANLYDGQCGANCHSCVKATDDSTGQSDCYCAPEEIRQVIWGKLLATSLDAGLCGDSCKECRWSWEEKIASGSLGPTAAYRCRDW